MQIMPSGGGWTNAAAAAQQNHNDLKNASPPHRASSVENAIQVDRSEKSGDRDAHERYDGQQGDGKSNALPEPGSERGEDRGNDLLSLPASEDAAPSALDLLG